MLKEFWLIENVSGRANPEKPYVYFCDPEIPGDLSLEFREADLDMATHFRSKAEADEHLAVCGSGYKVKMAMFAEKHEEV